MHIFGSTYINTKRSPSQCRASGMELLCLQTSQTVPVTTSHAAVSVSYITCHTFYSDISDCPSHYFPCGSICIIHNLSCLFSDISDCPSHYFPCGSICIIHNLSCLFSDISDCPSHYFPCGSICIIPDFVCDGVFDCQNCEDEQDCE